MSFGIAQLNDRLRGVRAQLERRYPPRRVQRCRSCGCTNECACPGNCCWIEIDLCSRCVDF